MTKHIAAIAAMALGVAALTACTPRQFESDPVTVGSPQGPVTCQLYTRNMLDWDRSINRPATMSVADADQICRAEGKRRQ